MLQIPRRSESANVTLVGTRVIVFVLFALIGCDAPPGRDFPQTNTTTGEKQASRVRAGAEVLADRDFEPLRGMRVGLIVNHTARVDTIHLVDAMRANGIDVRAIFGPEHGFRGDAADGEKVDDTTDPRTAIPVYSLYRAGQRQPPQHVLGELDVLVFDIQDVGARFYTFISTMGIAMQEAARAGIPFLVLDRPNPLGGNYVSGFVREPEHVSNVAMYPIPVAHGLTVGELAYLIQGERLLDGIDDLELTVIEMQGWRRDMQWTDTGRPWVPTSPNIPTFETALVYPGMCFVEMTTASEGRGTDQPFLMTGAPWIDASELVGRLNAKELPGIRFFNASFTPHEMPGRANSPKHEGLAVRGFRLEVTDRRTFDPLLTGVEVIAELYSEAKRTGNEPWRRPGALARLAGTNRLQHMIEQGLSADSIRSSWAEEVEAFETLRRPYLRYE